MACLIEDSFFSLPPHNNPSTLSVPALSFIRLLLRNNPLQKNEKIADYRTPRNTLTTNVLFESTGSFQCVSVLEYDPRLGRLSLKLRVLRGQRLLKVTSKQKIDSFCRLLQKYNIHLATQNMHFSINTSNGEIIIRHALTLLPSPDPALLKSLEEIALRMGRIVHQQMIFLVEVVNQTFQWQIYSKDNRYLQKIVAESNDALKIRELIALSHVSFQDSGDNGQAKYTRSKELINFLSNRENMVNPALRKQCFIGGELHLYCHFMQADYFTTHPLSLHTLQNEFTQEFNVFFYNFQPKKMANGDNPYLFNTILIKNEEKVVLRNVDCEGGFSRIEVAEVEIAYTESQNLVFDVPRSSSKNARQADPNLARNCEKITYIPKVLAIKICKSESDYEKIKHEKIIVQNFRTTASPFVLKYYNCTQRGFKYRQYLLMDYMGTTLTLLEYNEIHRPSFTLNFKMHVFIHISNALNFLEKQQVVHMDLSSHNLMIYRDLLVKVIDFGEAYHPYLDTDKSIKYNPGHTMPYCPPQTFNRLKKFSPKSDVFSIGVILYRILFNDFPFNPTAQLKEHYIDKSYLSRCMIAPQRLSDYGHHTQLTLILQLIMRCLSPVESYRPNAYWLYVILNKIFLTIK